MDDEKRAFSELTPQLKAAKQTDALPDAVSEPDAERLIRAYNDLENAPAQAVNTLTGLAERGSVTSMLYLGYAFRNGIGVTADLGSAEKWLRQAADAGLARAHYSLGRLYLDTEQYLSAKAEFERAASNGFMPAVHFLGRIHYFGFGVPVDKDLGRTLLKTASNWGCVYAKALLAHELIHKGRDVSAFIEGVGMKLRSYFDLVQVLWTEGLTSDRFR